MDKNCGFFTNGQFLYVCCFSVLRLWVCSCFGKVHNRFFDSSEIFHWTLWCCNLYLWVIMVSDVHYCMAETCSGESFPRSINQVAVCSVLLYTKQQYGPKKETWWELIFSWGIGFDAFLPCHKKMCVHFPPCCFD